MSGQISINNVTLSGQLQGTIYNHESSTTISPSRVNYILRPMVQMWVDAIDCFLVLSRGEKSVIINKIIDCLHLSNSGFYCLMCNPYTRDVQIIDNTDLTDAITKTKQLTIEGYIIVKEDVYL